MIRPPRGVWAFIIRTACCAHRKAPVRLVSTTACQSARSISSGWPAGPNTPALFTSRSSRPQRSRMASNSAATDGGEVTSVATARAESAGPVQACAVSASAPPAGPPARPASPPRAGPGRCSGPARTGPGDHGDTHGSSLLSSGDHGDRPPPGLDQPYRQRPDQPVPGLGGRADDHGVRADLVRYPPQLVVRVARRHDERESARPARRPLRRPAAAGPPRSR